MAGTKLLPALKQVEVGFLAKAEVNVLREHAHELCQLAGFTDLPVFNRHVCTLLQSLVSIAASTSLPVLESSIAKQAQQQDGALAFVVQNAGLRKALATIASPAPDSVVPKLSVVCGGSAAELHQHARKVFEELEAREQQAFGQASDALGLLHQKVEPLLEDDALSLDEFLKRMQKKSAMDIKDLL